VSGPAAATVDPAAMAEDCEGLARQTVGRWRGLSRGCVCCCRLQKPGCIQAQGSPDSGRVDAVEVSLRRAVAADAASVAEVWLRSFGTARQVHSPEDVHRWVRDVLIAERETWIAVAECTVVGMVLAGGWLDQLYLDPALARQRDRGPVRRRGQATPPGRAAAVDASGERAGLPVLPAARLRAGRADRRRR
jgi:hypothetical protein